MHDVIVIGGGISGLTAAWKLVQLGLDVCVLEAKGSAGGNIRTVRHDGFQLELGPYSFLGGSEYVWRLAEELGIEDLAVKSSASADNRYIYRNGKLLPLPMGPGSFISSGLLSLGGKLRLMAEPFVRNGANPEDTAWDFFVRRFGTEAATFIMGPFVSGIYAGDPRLLGAGSAFPKFHNFERDHGSMIVGAFRYMAEKRRRIRRENIKVRKGLYSFEGGLGTLTAKLAEQLGSRLQLGAEAVAVGRTAGGYAVSAESGTWSGKAVVCAVPPNHASRVLGSLVPDVRAPLLETPMSPVTLVHWSQPADASRLPQGFGFLMPRIYDLRVLGTIFASQLFSGRAPNGQALLTSYYGGMLDREAMNLSDSQVLDTLLQEHRRIFSSSLTDPAMVKVIRYPEAIPQLTVSHSRRMAAVKESLTGTPGIVLAGNYLTGVGVEHAVNSGYDAAAEVAGIFDGGKGCLAEAPA